MLKSAIGNQYVPLAEPPDQQQQNSQQTMEPFLGHQVPTKRQSQRDPAIAHINSRVNNMSMVSQSGVDPEARSYINTSQMSNMDQSKSSKNMNGRRNGMRGTGQSSKISTRPRTSKVDGPKDQISKYNSQTSVNDPVFKPSKRSLQLLGSANQAVASHTSQNPMNPLKDVERRQTGKKTPSVSEAYYEQDERQELRVRTKQSSGSKKGKSGNPEKRMGMRERREKEGVGNEVGKGNLKKSTVIPTAQETGSSDHVGSGQPRLADMEPFSGSSIEERNKKSIIGLGKVLADRESSSKQSPFKTYQGIDAAQITSVEKDRDLVISTKKAQYHRSFGLTGALPDQPIMSDKKSNITSNTGVHSPMIPQEDLQGDVRKRMDEQQKQMEFRGQKSVDMNTSKASMQSANQLNKANTRPKSKGKYNISTYARSSGHQQNLSEQRGDTNPSQFSSSRIALRGGLKSGRPKNISTGLAKHRSAMGIPIDLADEPAAMMALPLPSGNQSMQHSFNMRRNDKSSTLVVAPRSTKNNDEGVSRIGPKFDFGRHEHSRLSQGSMAASRSINTQAKHSAMATAQSKKQLSKSRSLLHIRDIDLSREKSQESQAADKDPAGNEETQAGFFDNVWNAIFKRDNGSGSKEEQKEGEVDGEQEDAVNDVLVTGDFKRRASRDSLVQLKKDAKNRLDLNQSREKTSNANLKRHAESHPGVKASMHSTYAISSSANDHALNGKQEQVDEFAVGLAQRREDTLRQPYKATLELKQDEDGHMELHLLKQPRSQNIPPDALNSDKLLWKPTHRNQHAKKENARKMSHIVDQPDPDSDSCEPNSNKRKQLNAQLSRELNAVEAANRKGAFIHSQAVDSAYASSITSGLQSIANGANYESRMTNRKNINENVSLAKAGQGMLPDNSAFPVSAAKASARSGAEYNVGEDEENGQLDEVSLAQMKHQILNNDVRWKPQVQIMKQTQAQESSGPPKLERTAGVPMKMGPGDKNEPNQDSSEMRVKNRRESNAGDLLVPHGSVGRSNNGLAMMSGGNSAIRTIQHDSMGIHQRNRNADSGSMRHVLGSGKSYVSSHVGPCDDTVAYDQKFTQFHRPAQEMEAVRIRDDAGEDNLRKSPARVKGQFRLKHREAKIIDIDLGGLKESAQGVREIGLNEHGGARSAIAHPEAAFTFDQDVDGDNATQQREADGANYTSGRQQRQERQGLGKYLVKSKQRSNGPADRNAPGVGHRDRSHGPNLVAPVKGEEVRVYNQTRKVQDFSQNRGHREGLAWAGATIDHTNQQPTAVDDIVSFFKGMFVAQPEERQNESDGKPRYQLQRGRQSAETKASSSQSALAQQKNRMNAASRANHNGWSPQEVLERFSGDGPDCLTAFEEIELGNYERIYTIGSVRRSNQYSIADPEGFYKVQVGEQLGYRYEVKRTIDKGSFGQVVMCVDMKDENQRVVAVKIGKNKKFDVDNAQVEVRILKQLRTKDATKDSKHHEGYDRIVEFLDSFNFRQHVIICFEYLHFNLYKFMKVNKLKRPTFEPRQLRRIVYQVSQGLRWMKLNKVIHCDMKPENIIFTDEKYRNVKIIDFGASCQDYSSGFFYVQSRYYRAPEIVLGNRYDTPVDIWSLGCIVYELITGRPLFPAKDENELLEYFMVTLGDVPQNMYVGCKKYKQFYKSTTSFLGYESHELIRSKESAFDPRRDLPVGQQPVRWLLEKHMIQDKQPEVDPRAINFIERCLVYDPQERMTPEEALQHDWFFIQTEQIIPAQK